MPSYILIGRRRHDFGIMIDFHLRRAMIKANTAFIKGVPLENIPAGISGLNQGMVLVKREWKDIYFLLEREGWTEDDYFMFAEERLRLLDITKP